MRIRGFVLPALAALSLTLSMVHVVRAQKTRAHPAPLVAPASNVSGRVAATGVIEPSSENVAIGSHRSGVAASVLVHPGQVVVRGAPLFCLDDRATRAEQQVRRAELDVARAQLDRVARSPRTEEVPPLVARVAAARARRDDAEDALRRTERLVSGKALPEEQGVRSRATRDIAAEEARVAETELALKRAGAWGPDRAVAAAAVKQAESSLDRVAIELDLLCATAPTDATVLRVDVRPGEFVVAGPSSLITLGSTQTLHVRADIDEVDIPRVRRDARATAHVRGDGQRALSLVPVRTEPAVVPKRTLSGASTERLDTRILQVVYRIEAPGDALSDRSVFVGQQVDVYIDETP